MPQPGVLLLSSFWILWDCRICSYQAGGGQGWLPCGLVHYLAGFIQTLLSDNFCPPLLRGSCQQYQISRGQCHIVSRSQALSSEIVHTNYSTELISLLRMSKFNTWESHATSRNIFHWDILDILPIPWFSAPPVWTVVTKLFCRSQNLQSVQDRIIISLEVFKPSHKFRSS